MFLGRHASMGFSCKLQNNAAIELLIPEHQNGHYARSPEMDFWLAQLVVCRKTGMRPARKLLSLNHLIKTDMFDILHNFCYTMIVLLSKGGFMQKVNIRDLLHNFSRYLKDVKEGDCITILERNKAVADIVPHNPNIRYPGWKRTIKKRLISGESFSETVAKNREQE